MILDILNWTMEKSEDYVETKKRGLCIPTEVNPQWFHEDFIHLMRGSLENYPVEQRNEFPDTQGIYFCCRSGRRYHPEEIWYIGKAKNFRQRWRDHHKLDSLKAIRFVEVFFLELEDWRDADICEFERKYIDMFRPVFNDVSVSIDGQGKEVGYKQGFADGCERTRKSTTDYYLQELAKLHTQNLELRQRLGL